MVDFDKVIIDSITLDAAYLSRGVPAVIEQLAAKAMGEVHARRDGNTRPATDAAVVSGETDREADASRSHGKKPSDITKGSP